MSSFLNAKYYLLVTSLLPSDGSLGGPNFAQPVGQGAGASGQEGDSDSTQYLSDKCNPFHLTAICAAIGRRHVHPKLLCLYRLMCVCKDFQEHLLAPKPGDREVEVREERRILYHCLMKPFCK